jgi:hypothetical protein
MKTHKLYIAVPLLLIFASCKPDLKPAQLYGTWKYTSVKNPNETPPDSVGHDELAQASPSIRFTSNDSLVITWGGKILSKGKFTTENQNINYTEDMEGGGTREFPFYVSKIGDKNIVFETLGEQGTRVTAVKE